MAAFAEPALLAPPERAVEARVVMSPKSMVETLTEELVLAVDDVLVTFDVVERAVTGTVVVVPLMTVTVLDWSGPTLIWRKPVQRKVSTFRARIPCVQFMHLTC